MNGARGWSAATATGKKRKNGAVSATLSRADQIIQEEGIDRSLARTSTIAPGTHNVIIDAGKPGAWQETHPDRRRCALTGLTRVNFREERFRTDPSFNHRQRWREIVPRPGNAAEAREVLDTIIDDQVENLNELLASNETIAVVADPDWADRAALELSTGFERLRRYQSAKIRELQRTLDTLCKLRKAELGVGNERGGMADGECPIADAQCQMTDEPCEVESGGCELKTPRKAPNEANLVSTQSTDAQRIESEKVDPDGRERSQSAAAGRVVRDAGSHDSPRLVEGSTNDAMGISPHEGTDGAVEACPGYVPEQSLDRVEKTPQSAPNKANLESTQSTYSLEVESEKADSRGCERSQFAAAGRVVQGAGNDRAATIMPAGECGGKARGRAGPSLPEAASQVVGASPRSSPGNARHRTMHFAARCLYHSVVLTHPAEISRPCGTRWDGSQPGVRNSHRRAPCRLSARRPVSSRPGRCHRAAASRIESRARR